MTCGTWKKLHLVLKFSTREHLSIAKADSLIKTNMTTRIKAELLYSFRFTMFNHNLCLNLPKGDYMSAKPFLQTETVVYQSISFDT